MKNIIKNLLAVVVITTSVAQASESVVSTIGDNIVNAAGNIAVAAANFAGAGIYSGSFAAKWLSSGLKELTERPALLAVASVATGYGLYYNYVTNKYQAVLDEAQNLANYSHPDSKIRNRNDGFNIVSWHPELTNTALRGRIKVLLLQEFPLLGPAVLGYVAQECAKFSKELSDFRMNKLYPLISNTEIRNSNFYQVSNNGYLNTAFACVDMALKATQRVMFPYQKRAAELHAQITAMIERLELIKEEAVS